VDVLLGKWDEARGVGEIAVLDNAPFDTGDKRLMLQALALHMQENEQKEIAAEDLHRLLAEMFAEMLADKRGVRKAVERFQRVIAERTGLLVARGEGVYAFSHLTFQEYLAALAIAARDDYVDYTLTRCGDGWWREVILLEAGFLSMLSKVRTTRLIRAIAEKKQEPEFYYNLVLAVECVRDVGHNRVAGGLGEELQGRLQAEFKSRGLLNFLPTTKRRRIAAATALAQIGGGAKRHWTKPFGEPEWVEIPAGEFWMGSEKGRDNEHPLHKVHLDTFSMARVPITNVQYALFVKAAEHDPPKGWDEDRPPKGKESHPVVRVTWHDAIAYCAWLSKVTGKHITLPSEAEWEKAARGGLQVPRIPTSSPNASQELIPNKLPKRVYPWGDEFETTRCNADELGLGDTTPVGIFLEGASPYGVLDLSGNVWEWTRSIWDSDRFPYPYKMDDREKLGGGSPRVLRGGAFYNTQGDTRCAYRGRGSPQYRDDLYGFRVCVRWGLSPN
ncbi:MAG: SUMF1/EgtB/PvdO family nonheme iron enzyme, partial [Chloroflexi bacterium]|nr:SUMF1/EgtB/PvdO family nonheme iron enzyme [Chloroflexota bacterium]